jgi:isoquinoline 1-oxidoreductase beta subunit
MAIGTTRSIRSVGDDKLLIYCLTIPKATNGSAPVKLVWGREDDMRAGFYRPMYYHTLKAGLDAQGNLVAWKHVIVGQSILTGTLFEAMQVKDGIDATSVEGAANLPYAIPNLAVELHSPKIGVPVQWWRSVGSTHTAFATECFLDEIAREAKKDPSPEASPCTNPSTPSSPRWSKFPESNRP